MGRLRRGRVIVWLRLRPVYFAEMPSVRRSNSGFSSSLEMRWSRRPRLVRVVETTWKRAWALCDLRLLPDETLDEISSF
jgi:hypothetical protein